MCSRNDDPSTYDEDILGESMFEAFEEDELRLISAALGHEISFTKELVYRSEILGLTGEGGEATLVLEEQKLVMLHNEALAEMDRRLINRLAHELVDDEGPYG